MASGDIVFEQQMSVTKTLSADDFTINEVVGGGWLAHLTGYAQDPNAATNHIEKEVTVSSRFGANTPKTSPVDRNKQYRVTITEV